MERTCVMDGLTVEQFTWLAQAGRSTWAWYAKGVGYFLFTSIMDMVKFTYECELVVKRVPVFLLYMFDEPSEESGTG